VKFLDLTGELLGKIDFGRSKIIQPEKLVFVCGGQKSGHPAAPTSMREVLLAKAEAVGKPGVLGGAKVLLAEAAVNALADSSFTNLLELERYIAAVVHAVILIVESPGSMCELGAFVMVNEIRDKLIVVMQGEYVPTPSFITIGAIKYFKDHQANAQVHGYDWKIDKASRVITAPQYAIDAMLAELPLAMEQVHSMHARELFRRDKLGHLIHLTLAFCHLLRAAKLIDIKRCFDHAGIDITENGVKHCIDTLMICKLLKMVPQGRLDYYVALVEKMPLEIAFKEATPKADKNTLRWITRIAEEIEGEEKFRLEMFVEHRNV